MSTDAIQPMNPQALIARAIDAGASVDTIERLTALAERMHATMAKQAWHEAMARFQGECPAITKTSSARIATTRGPSYSYKWAPLGRDYGDDPARPGEE